MRVFVLNVLKESVGCGYLCGMY